MKSGYLLAGASLLHSARAIPAYITTVFSCPDVMTITQTVYPPGWTATGPIYTTRPLTEPQAEAQVPSQQQQHQGACTETEPVTTSWETEYATTTVYYSQYGMYAGPPGCPSQIIAYMPTTVTCSEAKTTGWVGYNADIACASCTATTLVGIRPETTVAAGSTQTYVTIWTEVYVESGTTTRASAVGSQWVATGSVPTGLYPYGHQCTGTQAGAAGGSENTPTIAGSGQTYTRPPGGAYPSIDFSDPNVFGAGQSVPIVSQGYTSGAGAATVAPSPNPTQASEGPGQQGPYTWSRGAYPSIDYSDPNYFKGGQGTGTYPQAAPTSAAGETAATAAEAPTSTYPPTGATSRPPSAEGGRATSYPAAFSDTGVFGPASSISIVSLTERPSPIPATTTYTVPTNFGSNYASIDATASENFRPLSSGAVTIVSLTPAQTFAPPGNTATIVATTRATSAYPSIDFSNASVFAPVDPNASAPTGAAGPATTSGAAAPSASTSA